MLLNGIECPNIPQVNQSSGCSFTRLILLNCFSTYEGATLSGCVSRNAGVFGMVISSHFIRFLYKFVYLVQSDNYMDLSAFTTSNSHAIQLLWRGQCPAGEHSCIEAAGVSWTTGRNMLYSEVLRYERAFNLEHT